MAETNVTNVGGDTPYDDGDSLSETALREVLAQSNIIDYVVRGCGFSADFGANTLDIGTTTTRGNFAVLSDSNLAYPIFPDQATGISLPDTNGTNHVFIAYDAANDEIDYHVDTEDTAPSGPALKIGTVDTSSSSTTETNRSPPDQTGQFSAASIDDGDSPYTTQGEAIIFVDTSSAAVTVELASNDVSEGKQIVVVDDADNAATNNITVSTEGGETINPDGDSTKTIAVDGASQAFRSDGSDWDSDLALDLDELDVTALTATTATATTATATTLTATTATVTTETVDQSTTIADSSADPSANGEFRRNGTDVKVHTDDRIVDLSGANWNRTDIGTNTHTLTAWESAWVNTTDASAAFVDVTLPADADVADADRVEVGVEDATNATRINANAGQTILGQTANITSVGARTYEFKNADSAWMVR